MMRPFCRTLIVATGILLFVATCRQQDVADWTVLVYLNGDNNLVNYANGDFKEMAQVGSTQQVNIVVQFDRQRRTGQWDQTLRFRVMRNMPHEPAYAYQDLGEADMADGRTVEQFVTSSMNAFPAKHYAFVLWGHGYGPRLLRLSDTLAQRGYRGAEASICEGGASEPATNAPFRSGTSDDSDDERKQKTVLYNRELAEALGRALHGRRLDVFVFDECLMGMIENAYALRRVARYMVASEEVVPPDGLDYSDWLGKLVANPHMSPSALAATIAESYERTYRGRFDCLTMAAVDLNHVLDLGCAISKLSNLLIENIHSEVVAIDVARSGLAIYGNPNCSGICFYHVDLQRFCELLAHKTTNNDIRGAANAVVDVFKRGRIRAVAGRTTRATKGSNGLAIYFPPTGSAYCKDGENECGYERKNQYYPIEFVQQTRWTDFLHKYFEVRPGEQGPKSECKSAETNCTDPFAAPAGATEASPNRVVEDDALEEASSKSSRPR